MNVTLEFLIWGVCKAFGLTRRAFDSLDIEEQEDYIAAYQADQLLVAWQNRKQYLIWKARNPQAK